MRSEVTRQKPKLQEKKTMRFDELAKYNNTIRMEKTMEAMKEKMISEDGQQYIQELMDSQVNGDTPNRFKDIAENLGMHPVFKGV